MEKTAVRAVVIDPDPQWQQAVTAALTDANISVVASSSDPSQAAELVDEHAADLLLVGLEDKVDNRALYRLGRRVHKRRPEIMMIVFVAGDEASTVDAALAGGAYWAVDRRLGAAELVRAVSAAYRAQLEETGPANASTGVRERLTRRELEILRLRAEGHTSRGVAKILWVTDQTIRFHLANTYKKLGVANLAEAIRWAISRGLISPRRPPGPDDDPEGEPGSGVREPRRPINPSQTGSIAVDPAEAA